MADSQRLRYLELADQEGSGFLTIRASSKSDFLTMYGRSKRPCPPKAVLMIIAMASNFAARAHSNMTSSHRTFLGRRLAISMTQYMSAIGPEKAVASAMAQSREIPWGSLYHVPGSLVFGSAGKVLWPLYSPSGSVYQRVCGRKCQRMPRPANDYHTTTFRINIAMIASNVNFLLTATCFESSKAGRCLQLARRCQIIALDCQVSDLQLNSVQMRKIQPHPLPVLLE